MSDDIDATVDPSLAEAVPEAPAPFVARDANRQLADQLIEQARTSGVNLVGPGGLLADITKRVLKTGLEVEMAEHLGYEKHAVAGRDGGHSRNGTRSKTVLTEIGPVTIDVPRDCDATFEPLTVKVCDGQVASRAFYCAIGVSVDGQRDILGIWPSSWAEGAKSWLCVLTVASAAQQLPARRPP